ncbi:porin [Phaeovibrio sulfidiphilus]|uniref:Porin n=1 Tax=Phaeovibrio sulfidiphilus TaxID=1220600 RepID=A0A8J6YY04_9PROT|nr:porin [Phaeovibrio sulfidiphilus]MBE1236623.1 porin [Phaeovibrio sulfidiphilus]
MKKLLLATTTIAGVSLAAGSASAAEKIKLELGGYMEEYFGGVKTLTKGLNSDGRKAGGRDGFGIDTEVRVYVQGSTVLDNGLTVGAFISFIGEGHTDDGQQNVEEQWAYISGDFGALYAGERDGVFDQFAVRAPNVTGRTGQDIVEWSKYSGGTEAGADTRVPSLETTLDDNSPRATYVTPSWYGLSAGVSFAPRSEIGGINGVRVREKRTGSNEVQAGLALDTAVGDWGIMADASVATTLDGVDRWAYRSGLVLTYGNFAIGGSYLGTSASDKERKGGKAWEHGGVPSGNNIVFRSDVWEAGMSYEVGPYAASFTYSQNNSDFGDALAFQLGGAYKLGPGITAVGQVFYAETDGNFGRDDKRSGVGALSGLILEF